MRDIEKRLKQAWPGIVSEIVPSDYFHGGLALRVWLNEVVLHDLTIYKKQWVVFMTPWHPDLPDDRPPLKRLAYEMPVSFAAPPREVTPAFVDLLRENWEGSQLMRQMLLDNIKSDEAD